MKKNQIFLGRGGCTSFTNCAREISEQTVGLRKVLSQHKWDLERGQAKRNGKNKRTKGISSVFDSLFIRQKNHINYQHNPYPSGCRAPPEPKTWRFQANRIRNSRQHRETVSSQQNRKNLGCLGNETLRKKDLGKTGEIIYRPSIDTTSIRENTDDSKNRKRKRNILKSTTQQNQPLSKGTLKISHQKYIQTEHKTIIRTNGLPPNKL